MTDTTASTTLEVGGQVLDAGNGHHLLEIQFVSGVMRAAVVIDVDSGEPFIEQITNVVRGLIKQSEKSKMKQVVLPSRAEISAINRKK